jgi:hypothetical protein
MRLLRTPRARGLSGRTRNAVLDRDSEGYQRGRNAPLATAFSAKEPRREAFGDFRQSLTRLAWIGSP